MEKKNKQLYFIALLFLISGIAGLIYEIVWERLLQLYFGVTNVSIVLIVSAYMAGLGFGSLFGGYISSRSKNLLFLYGLVELAIALFGFFSLNIIGFIGSSIAGAPYVLVFITSFLVLFFPTFLMGMTLPLLSQAFITRVEKVGEIVGLLYGINTLGAAIGSFLTGFFLIGRFGLSGAVYIACAMNMSVGVIALLLARMLGTEKPEALQAASPSITAPSGPSLPSYQGILSVSFLVGFLGLGYEIFWIRVLNIINKNTVYGFPAILGVFLVGLALGGYFFGRRADRSSDPYRMFWKLEIAIACVSAMTVLLYWLALDVPVIADTVFSLFRTAQRPDSGFVLVNGQYDFSIRRWTSGMLSFMLPIVWLVLPPSFFMGAGLPVLDRIAIRQAQLAGARIGSIHLLNILGSVAGAFTVSFGFLTWFGSELTLKILVMLGLIFMLVAPGQTPSTISRDGARVFSIALVILVAVLLPSRETLYQKYFQAGTQESKAIIREYQDGVLALTSSYLWIRGDEHGSYPSDGVYESMVLPCLGANQPRRVLMIGLGGGNTLHFLSKVPGIEEIVVVELMQGLDGFLRDHVGRIGESLNDPRVKLIADDGRRYLYANPDEKFDLIFTDPLRHYSAGHNSLYSVEAQVLYRMHLSENGVYCQWQDENHVIPKTTASVFPEVDGFDLVAVASERPVRYDLQYMEQVADQFLTNHGSHLTIDAAEQMDVASLIQSFLRDRAAILHSESDTPVITDVTPILEYYLFRLPIRHPIRVDRETMEDFIARLDGCDDKCRQALLKKVR